MTHAYNEMYLAGAMRNMAVMTHYGVNVYGLKPDDFYDRFIRSGIADKIANGNPRYLAGLSGAELAERVITETGGCAPTTKITGQYSITPEYWAGWVLAYYQWYTAKSFSAMRSKGLSLSKAIKMYHPLHEADLSKFVEVADSISTL